MKLTYPKVQKILDLIESKMKSIDEKTKTINPQTYRPLDSFDTASYKSEEEIEKDLLQSIKDDLLSVINMAEFDFSLKLPSPIYQAKSLLDKSEDK